MRFVIAPSIVALLMTSACASGDGATSEDADQGSTSSSTSSPGASAPKIHEVNVTNQPEFKNGQTAIVINPKNHDNLVFTATKHNLMTEEGLTGKFTWGCFVAYSMDRGETWTPSELPYGGTPGCGEPNPQVDSDGNFYILFNKLFSFDDDLSKRQEATANNKIGVSRSTDGGKTWSEPIEPPLSIGGQPKLGIDHTTNKIYAVGGLEFLFPSGLSVSEDGGQTWSEPRVLPKPDGCLDGIPLPGGRTTPCGFPGVQLAVHAGVIATGVNRTAEDKIEFHVSVDDGKTWTETQLTDSQGKPVPSAASLSPSDPGGGEDPVPWVTADETTKNRFAVMVPRAASFEVYMTSDAGKTFTGPVVIDAPDENRPWINFGLSGGLGVMWRTTAVDAYSVFSFDAGKTFSKPVKVNSATYPFADSNSPGDDWSNINSDDKFVYVVWSDGRNGDTIDGIFARIPIEAYK